MLVTMLMLAMAAPNPATLNAPRKSYAACIKQFEDRSFAAKMDLAAYTVAVKGACSAEAATLVKAMVDYDVAIGDKRASATANAESDVADYRQTSQERYHDMMPPTTRTTTTASAAPPSAPPKATGAAQKVDASAPQ